MAVRRSFPWKLCESFVGKAVSLQDGRHSDAPICGGDGLLTIFPYPMPSAWSSDEGKDRFRSEEEHVDERC